jgi:hypothetical protein
MPLQVAVHLVLLVAGSVQGQVVPGRSSESGLALQKVPAQQAAAMFGQLLGDICSPQEHCSLV